MREHKPLVPIPYRSAVSRVLSLPGLNFAALGAYQRIGTLLAQRFVRHDGVLRVFHFGGSVNRCVPGISDVDFLILCDSPEIRKEALTKEFCRAKRRFLVPGELHLASSELWNEFLAKPFASRIWFFPQREWTREGWASLAHPFLQSSPASRFFAAYLHFQKATDYWAKSRLKPNHFFQKSFDRESSKALALANGNIPGVFTSQKPIERLGNIFEVLHSIALKIPQIPLKSTCSNDLEIWNTSFPFWKAQFPLISCSTIPGTVRLDCSEDIQSWYRFIKGNRLVPIPISREMESVLNSRIEWQKEEEGLLKRFVRISNESLR